MKQDCAASVACLLVLFVAAATHLRADGEEKAPDRFSERVRPFLQQYCTDCHFEGDPTGGIAFDRFDDQSDALGDGEVWIRVRDVLESRVMPPQDMPQPRAEEIARVVEWIESDFFAARCGDAPAPAAVVIRRMNRREYNNTIRDLIGIGLQPANDFPQDDIGFGFDNIGAALHISPIHVERYLEAAERVLRAAIVLPNAEEQPPKELIGLQPYRLTGSALVELEHEFAAGRFLFDVTLVGPFQSSPPPKIAVELGNDRRIVEAVVVQDESAIYRLWLQPGEGTRKATVGLADAPKDEDDDPAKKAAEPMEGQYRRDPNGVTLESIVARGPCRLKTDRLPDSHRRILFCTPEPGEESRLDCARRIVTQFAERAFRRPLRTKEVDRLLEVFRLAEGRGESFERAIQIALTPVLVSPKFLFLVEPEISTEDRLLNEFELASRLSYFLWSSMPDEELFRHAREETLRRSLREQVTRMLNDPKSQAFVENFTGQWLQLRRLDGVTPDPDLFPGFNNKLRTAMREETERFFAAIVREDRSVLELLDADYTFLNERLARHYGIKGIAGPEFQRISLSDGRRGGVLTQASVLTLTSNPNRTSPVKRGQWILEQLLGTPPPPPPPEVEPLDESRQASQAASLRERLELHRANSECASCHNRMDPLGFALENYDAIGAWRSSDGEFPIDPAGTLTDGRQFADAKELKALLKSQPKQFCTCLIENLLMYALGRGLEPYDHCTVEAIRRDLARNEYRFSTIIFGIVESNAFQHRGVTR